MVGEDTLNREGSGVRGYLADLDENFANLFEGVLREMNLDGRRLLEAEEIYVIFSYVCFFRFSEIGGQN